MQLSLCVNPNLREGSKPYLAPRSRHRGAWPTAMCHWASGSARSGALALLCVLIWAGMSLPAAAETIFTTQTPAGEFTDGVSYEMGMKFQTAVAGKITAIRYWKAPSEAATGHTGHLWDASGNLLATVNFAGETASGWQQQALATPVTIQANTTYVVSVNIVSYYVATVSGLATSIVNGNLSSVADGQNGVFGNAGSFPTSSFNNTNYFRDVVFETIQPFECIAGEKSGIRLTWDS